jgi:uncharacterized C2H2 Zn-finger protein
MGFKCPLCFQDFRCDKKAWQKHIKNKHDGIGEAINQFLKKVTKKEKD